MQYALYICHFKSSGTGAISSAGVFASGVGGMGGYKFRYHSRCASLNSSRFLILPYFFGFSK